MSNSAPDSADWQHLIRIAEDEVRAVLDSLPRPLHRLCSDLPVVYDARTHEELQAEDLGDLLGLFVGHPSHENDGLPPQILLFLRPILEEAGHSEPEFRHEVRRTFVHELGHYLGLEESDLEERGLL